VHQPVLYLGGHRSSIAAVSAAAQRPILVRKHGLGALLQHALGGVGGEQGQRNTRVVRQVEAGGVQVAAGAAG